MSRHAFVDESYRREYVLCAVIVDSDKVRETRRLVAGMLRGNQRRIHMSKESRASRKLIVERVSLLHIEATTVSTRTAGRSRRSARNVALTNLTDVLRKSGVTRVVIESCDQDAEDRQVIGDRLAKRGEVRSMDVYHLRPSEDPLLWLPDIVAWVAGNSDPIWAEAKQALLIAAYLA